MLHNCAWKYLHLRWRKIALKLNEVFTSLSLVPAGHNIHKIFFFIIWQNLLFDKVYFLTKFTVGSRVSDERSSSARWCLTEPTKVYIRFFRRKVPIQHIVIVIQVLLYWYCYSAIVILVLLCWYCCSGIAQLAPSYIWPLVDLCLGI